MPNKAKSRAMKVLRRKLTREERRKKHQALMLTARLVGVPAHVVEAFRIPSESNKQTLCRYMKQVRAEGKP